MSTISCILHALIGGSLAVNFQKRSIQIGDNEIGWQYDAGDLTENGKIEFKIRTKLNQLSFGWNRDESLGGDLVFIDIVEDADSASSMDNSQLFVHDESSADGKVNLNESGSQSAWTLIDIKFENETKEIGLERSLKYFCNDPFEINAEAIRMMVVAYNTAVVTSNGRTGAITIDADNVANKVYKTTHLIDYKAVKKPDCGDENTECIEEYVDVELTNERTQYFCKFIQLPEPNEKKSKHMIGYQPVNNDTIGVLHHVIIYTCSGITEEERNRHHDEAKLTDDYFKCGDYTMEYFMKCFHAVAVWAVGGTGLEMPENVGYPINGDDSADRWALMEVHFDNPSEKVPEVLPIRAGLKMQYAKERRPMDAGLISSGASWMFYLPPKQKEFSLWGTCSHHCLEAAGLEDKITVFAGMAHGHRHLKDLTLSKVTKNADGDVTAVKEVFREENYDRMYQEYKYLKNDVEVSLNEDLIVQCKYNTENTDKWVRGGLEQVNEMCYAFIYYYPRLEDISFCTSMTTFEDVYDFWRPKSSGVIGEPTYQYNRPGHPDEFQIGESNAEDFFDANFPDVSTELANQYQNMMRNANQHPMCMSSGMNVFMKDDEDSTPEGEPSPEGGANAWDPFGDESEAWEGKAGLYKKPDGFVTFDATIFEPEDSTPQCVANEPSYDFLQSSVPIHNSSFIVVLLTLFLILFK